MAIRSPEKVTIIGEAPNFLEMQEHVSRAAGLSKPVLVVGERGTGKELIASRLHYLSERWGQPLVKLNCAALTESILESELFGHQAGAFTGASSTRIGCFERAHEGSLFLDELGTISLRMQEKILRVTEYGEFERVGGTETIRVDVRIIGASNENLPGLVAQNRFRPDLLDRLAFDVVAVPPLRARQEDILTLANHFAVIISSELKRDLFAGFSHRAASALLSYPWPGNVRELKHTVERSVYRHQEPARKLREIVFDPFDSPFVPGQTPIATTPSKETTAVTPLKAPPFPLDLREEVDQLEQTLVREAMKKSQFKQAGAARMLGLSYHQLRGLMRKHDLVSELGRKRR